MTIPILTSAETLLARFGTVICDVWGVVHDGIVADPAACAALARYRRDGGTVVLVTNSPSAASEVIAGLAERNVPREAWDGIVTSGDMTRLELIRRGVRKVYHTGTDRHLSMVEGLALDFVPLEDAEAVLATELFDFLTQSPEDYRPILTQARARNLPLICANPDLIVHVGERLLPCAGSLALIYEQLGGDVFWAGKPYRPIYERALEIAAGISGLPSDPATTLAIGDAVRTDMAGAAGMGFQALFIAGGIHRDEILRDGEVDAENATAIVRPYQRNVVAAMVGLA